MLSILIALYLSNYIIFKKKKLLKRDDIIDYPFSRDTKTFSGRPYKTPLEYLRRQTKPRVFHLLGVGLPLQLW
jgi:hypothetical protein